MKLRFFYILFAAIMAYVVLSSRTTGPAFNGLGNRTGSPGSNGTCGGCHSGGAFTNPSISIVVKNSLGNTVTSYVPGQTYTLEYTASAGGSPVGYGMQSLILNSSNTATGTMVSALTPNTRVVSSTFVEQTNVQANGFFSATWTAPAAGTGTATVYAITLAVNDNNNTNGDIASPTAQLALPEANATINYAQASYCSNGSNPTPTQTGTTGGAYSATPAGLSINSSTGTINLAASTPGTYTVSYTFGGNVVTDVVTITAPDAATINYANTNYCQNAADPAPTQTGAVGTYSAAPAGLAINGSTGIIDVSASTPGNYTINYTTTGACPTTATDNVTISATESAAFSYTQTAYCTANSAVSPAITGASGGTFSASPAGLSLNTSTGQITPASSSLGNYTITYTTTGTCPGTQSVSVSITAPDAATMDYAAANYCQNESDPSPVQTGTAGTYTASPAGLSLNATTGEIDLSASLSDTYTITYTTNGACPVVVTDVVVVEETNSAALVYGSATYCQSNSNPTPVVVNSGGAFSASPAGLVLNSTTGEIDLAASAVGNYTISYQTAGNCPDQQSVNVNITASGDASFNYNGDSLFCLGAPNAVANITGIAGGTFSVSPMGLIFANNQGTIHLGFSAAGSYQITYQVTGACSAVSSLGVFISEPDDASFAYPDTVYCLNTPTSVPIPVVSGTQGGLFSATPSGLVFADPVTGEIDLEASTPGLYTIQYQTIGDCPDTATVAIALETCLGIEEMAAAASAFLLYPNPTSGDTYLYNPMTTDKMTLQLFDALGQLIQEQTWMATAGETLRLPTAALPSGVYFLRLQQGTQQQFLRLQRM